MKKIILVLFLVSLISLSSALEFNVSESYSQGQTIILKVSGSFPSGITSDQVVFYRGSVKIPMDYGISKLGDEYYLYALLVDKSPGNYSMVVEDLKYQEGSKIVTNDVVKNFTITEDLVDFYVSPGYLISDTALSFKLQNLKDSQIEIDWKFLDKSGSESVKSGQIKDVKIPLTPSNESKREFLSLSSENTEYEVPVYVLKKVLQEVPQVNFTFDPEKLNISMDIDSNYSGKIIFQYTGNIKIPQVNFLLDDFLKRHLSLKNSSFFNLSPLIAEEVEFSVFSGDLPLSKTGNLTAVYGSNSLSLPITLNFIPGYVLGEKDVISPIKNCSGFKGNLCGSSSSCNGSIITSSDGLCCIGNCTQIVTASYWTKGKIIGWAIILAVLILVAWIYLKYKNTN